MGRGERRLAERLAHDLLEGLGDARLERVDPKGPTRVIHVRRPLRPDELALLPPAFLAAPAVDGAGQGGYLDEFAREAAARKALRG